MKFSHSFKVAAEDIDAQGHVNNVAYVRWIQDVAVAHWFAETDEKTRERFTWVVLRHEIDYKNQGFENEEITVTTWVGEWKAASCVRFTEISRGAVLLVKSKTIWCMIDKETNKLTRIREDLKSKFLKNYEC